MKKFSQLSEAKIEVNVNSVNYLTVNELKKYLDKFQSEFYNKVAVDVTTKDGKSYTKNFDPKAATLKIIDYLIKHNDTYITELGGSNNKENALAAFYQRSLPSDPEKKELYKALFVLNKTLRLKEVPTFMTREEFDDVMHDKCSLDYVVYDLSTERGRNKLAKQYSGLVFLMANKYKNHANVDWNEWIGAGELGITYAMNYYHNLKGLMNKKDKNTENIGFSDNNVKYDEELKKEVKTETKSNKYSVKFIVFAKWMINFCMLTAQEDSHLVRIPKSAQARERKLNGSNRWNNTTSMDNPIRTGSGEGSQKTIGDTIGSSSSSADNLNRMDSDRIFGIFYTYLKKHFDKLSLSIFFTHFGLQGLEKIGTTEWSEYLSNCKKEDMEKLYDAIINADVEAEKQWIQDYKDGKFPKPTEKVKGAGKSSISIKMTDVLKWIRSDKTASKAMKELYMFECQVKNEKDREQTFTDVFNANNMIY